MGAMVNHMINHVFPSTNGTIENLKGANDASIKVKGAYHMKD